MTFQEFTQKVKEYDAAWTPQLTEKEYALIEKAYAFHPSISETDGKSQVALLWCEFGIRIFMDMEETADKAALAEKKIQIARANLAACLDEYEAIRRGEA